MKNTMSVMRSLNGFESFTAILREVRSHDIFDGGAHIGGEYVQNVKAEYPRKVNIALNRKTATELGIVFSLDVLNLANVIFDDYEGKQVIRT